MKTPEIPSNESRRLAALRSLNVLDTPAEARFDRITRAAQQHFQVSIALVSLVDEERQWFKSRQGLEAIETPRDISFCGHAILSDDIFYIPNALKDPRFADNPLVTGPPNIRFYAGAPLHAPDGKRVGTLCIIDDKPREFSAEELAVLRDLADEVEQELGKSLTRVTFSIVQKLSLSSVLLVLLSVGVVGVLFYNKATTLLVDLALEAVSREVQNAGDRLKTIISTQDEDVLFLANTPPIQGILRTRSRGGFDEQDKTSTTDWAKRLEAMFKSELLRKSAYLSIRFIDAKGQELVVVSRRGQEIVGLSGKQLQNKGHRDYVSETLKLPAGSVYVSEINLNREFGKVTWPRHEVVRSATPVYDEINSRLAGLVSITAEIGGKLHATQIRVKNRSSGEIYITNDRGDYLVHPDSNKTYGFDLGKKYTIKEDFPQLAHLFFPENRDEQVSLTSESANGRQIMSFTKVAFDPNNLNRFIAIIITHDYHRVASEQSKLLNNVVLWTLLLIIPGAGLGVLFSIGLTRPIKQITQAMDDYIHQRDSKETMPIHLNNEIGVMARIYQSLIGLVEEAHTNLAEMNNKLETRVVERTKALEISEARQRSILENIIDGLITIDDKGIVASFNPAATSIFGYTAEEVKGRNIKMLMPEPYTSEHDGYLQNYLSSGEKKVIGIGREVTGKRKNGSTFPMELAVSEMMINGERMFTGIVRDITERKKIENMKSEFISTVSHELRTPLTSIRGALGLVLGRSADQLSDKARNMLEMANRNSERLTLLINDILDLEKIESGRLEFHFATVDLVSLTRRALEDNEGYAQNHQVTLQLDTTLDSALVWGDEHRLLQVFANLISNAVKYSPKGGQVEISISAQEGGYRVAVRDHGKGIPEEFRTRIFQRFAQADSSDTREKGGTGLGLSIAKAIVEFHKGSIGYESESDKGTVFHFDLPSSAQHNGHEHLEETNGIQVLICEDNIDVAAILAEMLESKNVVSDIATTAEAARTLLRNHAYRLLLLDLTLPDADGLQFLQELRATPATVELPVIVVSGRAEEGRIAFKGDAVTVVDWLQKPIDEARLERALHEALQRTDRRPRILHVEDDLDIVQVTRVLLEEMADVSHVPSLVEARRRLATEEFDLVVLDLGLADGSGLELLDELKGRCPVVIFSAQIPDREISEQVNAALTKSMTSNEQLLATIMKVLQG